MGAAQASLLCTHVQTAVSFLRRSRPLRALTHTTQLPQDTSTKSTGPFGPLLSSIDWGLREVDWTLTYTFAKHGASARALHNVIKALRTETPCIAVIEDDCGSRFGCLWYSGTQTSNRTIVFRGGDPMSGSAQHVSSFVASEPSTVLVNNDTFSVGVGARGNFAFCLDDALYHGFSYHSIAFGSPPLAHDVSFNCVKFDVWVPVRGLG